MLEVILVWHTEWHCGHMPGSRVGGGGGGSSFTVD